MVSLTNQFVGAKLQKGFISKKSSNHITISLFVYFEAVLD